MLTAEKIETKDPDNQTPKGQTSLEVVGSVREAVPNIDKPPTIPETTKPLRLVMQSHMQGELTYSAESLPEGKVKVNLKIQLPPDPKQAVEIKLSAEDFTSLESLKTHLRIEVFDFVFKEFTENNGLEDGDPARIDEMAEDIFDTFRK